jgi:hypothetical protein
MCTRGHGYRILTDTFFVLAADTFVCVLCLPDALADSVLFCDTVFLVKSNRLHTTQCNRAANS